MEKRQDLISRQAAIDAVEFGITYAKAINVNTGESKELFKEGNDALKKAVERLKELSSAQPEWGKPVGIDRPLADSEIIPRLQAIKAQIGGSYAIERTIEVLEQLSSAQPEPQWIPCSEALPEDGKWCLFTDSVSMSVERYKADAMDHFFPEGKWFSFEDAVAWMPLPEPYKGGGQNDGHN